MPEKEHERLVSRDNLVAALKQHYLAALGGKLPKAYREALFDRVYGLGPGARVRLLAILHGSIGGFGDDLGLSKEQTGPRKPNAKTRQAVLQWLADHKTYPTLDEATLFTTHFFGHGAVEACLYWLETGHKPLADDVTLLPAKKFHPSAARDRLLDNIEAFLGEPTLQPIMTVIGDGMSEGMRALSAHLCERLAKAARRGEEVRPVVYLPVNRDPVTQEKISYARLVGYLAAYYRRQPLRNSPVPASTLAIRQDLRFIRHMMAKEPCTLILDGWAAYTGAMPKLGSLMIDDGLVSLLEEIIHPDRNPDLFDKYALNFNDNRIIVLASTTVRARNAFVHREDELPAPLKEQMPEIAKGQNRADSLIDVIDEMKAQRTDVALALAEFVHNKPAPPGHDDATPLIAGSEDRLAKAALAIVRQRPLANLVLATVILMPDGMRVDTLARVAMRWRQAWIGGSLSDAWALGPFDIEDVKSAVDWLGPLLRRGQDSHVAGLDDVEGRHERADMPRSPAYSEEEGPLASQPADHEIWPAVDAADPTWKLERLWVDFAAPRLRTLMADHLILSDEIAIARLHRLLAEEALNQHNLVVRHGDWHDADDVRFYRRLLQALYHGCCSLALGPDIEDIGLRSVADRSLPATARRAYVRLYAVLYRALLEAPPEWGLSRVLGRDDIKVDLLRLMINLDSKPPWRMLTDARKLQFEAPAYLDAQTQVWSTDVALAVDQLTALAKAALRNNELEVAASAADAGLNLVEPHAVRVAPLLPTSPWTPAMRVTSRLRKLISSAKSSAVKIRASQTRDGPLTSIWLTDFRSNPTGWTFLDRRHRPRVAWHLSKPKSRR